ncbi:MAG: glycosyltransferase family 39 protein [bacterium]
MKITFFEKKNFYLWLGFSLLLLMRFFLSWFATFSIDSPLIYTRTAELFNTGMIPPFAIHVPITHNAFIPGPGISVLYWLIYVITKNPIYVGMVTGILQLLGVFVIYRLFSEAFSRKTATIVAFLMLMNPWLSYYSVGLWNPSLIFLFSSLAFYALFRLKQNNKIVYWIILGFSLCMAVQVHMSAFLLILISFIYLVFYRIWPNFKSILAGLAVFVLLFLSYIKYEIINHGSNTINLFTGATGTSFKLESLLRAIHFSVILQSSEVAHFAGAGLKHVLLFYSYHPILSVLLIPLSLLTAYFSYMMFWVFLKNNFSFSKIRYSLKTSPMALLFLLAFIINPLIYYFTPRPFSPHNLIVIAPFLWIPIAAFINEPGKLYFPYIDLRRAGYAYAFSSLIAVYMILVSHPYQIPVKDLIKVVEFIGDEKNAPVSLEIKDQVIELDALETIHKNYFGRPYNLIAKSEKAARPNFILINKRLEKVDGLEIFSTPSIIIIKK